MEGHESALSQLLSKEATKHDDLINARVETFEVGMGSTNQNNRFA